MRLRLNPYAPNGLEVYEPAATVIQGGSSSSTVPNISYGTATPTDGVDTPSHLYYDTNDATLYVYVNGIWYPITGGSPPSEDGYWDSTNTNWDSTTINWDAV